MLDWDLGSRAVPNIGGRVIDVFALHQDHSTDIQGVDLPGLIRKLLLFDTVIFKSFGFHEFPHLVRLLGYDGVMELLKSGAIELYCDSTMIGGDFQRSDQPRPSDIYDFGAISIPREQFIHKCLQVIHTIPGLRHTQVVKLKKTIVTRLVESPPKFGEDILAQFRSDIRLHPELLRRAVSLHVREIYGTCPDFSLTVADVPNAGFRVQSDLSRRLGVDEGELRKIVNIGFFAIANVNHRLGEMRAQMALSGSLANDYQLIADKLTFLAQSLDPSIQEQSFQRVLQIEGIPDIVVSGAVDIGRLLAVRQSSECIEFRRWLQTVPNYADKEIRDQLASVRSRLATFATSGVGKAIRFVACTGLGLIPGAGLAIGPAAGFVDYFVLEKLFPRSGIIAFLSESYPSIFKSP